MRKLWKFLTYKESKTEESWLDAALAGLYTTILVVMLFVLVTFFVTYWR